ncbi:MAG: hydantoinase/oxoprolinase family protein [Gammaproteobacteria bacterium]|nr:hydantoinase/oxoprolinase family protein [Gammaproteobacteria bacterium]
MTGTRYVVGVDIGGTFTDLVAIDARGGRTVVKTPTTPSDQSVGMLNALKEAAARLEIDFADFLSRVDRICHGTTVTTNAVIVRSGARVGMLTTRGLRDTIEVRRGMRELQYLYDYTYPQPEPLCPRNLRMPITERLQADASVHKPLAEDEVRAAARELGRQNVEAVAICFLWSFRNPAHELRAAQICREELPQAYLSLSHEIAPILGEYLRFQTTVMNAYVGPTIRRYMTAMEKTLRDAGYRGPLLIVTSSGGVLSPQAIVPKAAVTLTSGPASGPIAATWYGEHYGMDNFITMDMGGTSFDTALVRNRQVPVRAEQTVADVYHIGLPTVDVHAIGAGGGTVAWLDEAGGLHVGPRSQGADPGPACYLRGGTEPTVTDANLVLGRLNPDYFVGGHMALDKNAAVAAIRRIAEPKGMSVEDMARAILRISVAKMADATEVISVRRGENPREYTLLVGGGAGPGHAAEIARVMGVRKVLIPRESSIFCAVGGLIADIRHDHLASIETPARALDWEQLNARLAAMRAEADHLLAEDGIAPADRLYSVAADMKYIGQYHEISIDWPARDELAYAATDLPEIERLFHERHETLYAHHDPLEQTFVSNLKLTAIGRVPPVRREPVARSTAGPGEFLRSEREVWFEETGFAPAPVYDGDRLLAGIRLPGPCIVEQATTTTVVPPGYTLEVLEYGDFLIDVPA